MSTDPTCGFDRTEIQFRNDKSGSSQSTVAHPLYSLPKIRGGELAASGGITLERRGDLLEAETKDIVHHGRMRIAVHDQPTTLGSNRSFVDPRHSEVV